MNETQDTGGIENEIESTLLRDLSYDDGVLVEVDYASKIFSRFYDVWHSTVWTLTQKGKKMPRVARVFGTGFYIYVIQETYDLPHTACIFSDYDDHIIIHGFIAEKDGQMIKNHINLDGFSDEEWLDFFNRSKKQ